MIKHTLVGAALALAVTVPGLAADDEIMAIDQTFAAMSASHGVAAAFSHYLANDAVKLDGGSHAKFGHDVIVAELEGLPTDTTLDWKPEDGKIAASGDLAYTWGTYVFSMVRDGQRRESHGKYITIWEKRDGEWKAILDGGNTSPGPWDGKGN
ncbi:YybH family protein [Kordiimonas aestuarii]|uniref:YybH family protein n=1 Tax=Kordiimonas aestuarii TaxID=1005925 RepID=UPI0021D11811|nr:nuclear transport factor 2 family protein [Kordiimonas aestuarii]